MVFGPFSRPEMEKGVFEIPAPTGPKPASRPKEMWWDGQGWVPGAPPGVPRTPPAPPAHEEEKEYTTDEAKVYVLGALVDRLREQNRTLQTLCERQVGEWQRLRAVVAIWKRRAVEEAEQRGIPPALIDEVWPDPTDAQIEAEILRGGAG